VLGQHRSTQRKAPRGREDEGRLVADIIELTRQYGRYGYRKIAALLRQAGWLVNDKRVERIWRCEGLKVPTKQPKRGRLWLNDGSCVRLRAERTNHVWSYDFVEDRTHEGKKYRMLNVVDEFTRECLSIRVNRRLNSTDVIDVLSDLFILRGVPEHIRSDNGPEFVAKAVQKWIHAVGAKTAYIAPGSPWENGYVLAEPSFAWTRALTPDCVTTSSTESFSTRLQRLGSSSRAGGGTITVSDLTHHSDTNHRRQKCLYPATLRGRLRSLKRLQRPHSP